MTIDKQSKQFQSSREKSRPTLGFLINWLGGIYQSELWQGIVQAAKFYDTNLISFSGGDLKSPYGYISQSNALYDLVSSDNVDGLLIAASSISSYVSHEYILNFCRQFQPLPIVSISLELESIPSVLVDNNIGMQAMLEHLILEHHAHRIAFIKGPEGNIQTITRYSAYRNTLDKYEIPFDPNLVVAGDFSMQAGMLAARELLARNISFEAVVAANDAMALGAQEEFQEHGLNIPADFALVGFDDVEEAQYNSLPLTTVRLPTLEHAKKSVELLVAQLEGKVVSSKVVLPTQLVIRQSCGCMDVTIKDVDAHTITFSKGIFRDEVASHRQTILEQMAEQIKPLTELLQTSSFNHNEQLLNILVDDLDRSTDSHSFLTELNRWVESVPLTRYSLTAMQGLISVLRRNILQHISDDLMLRRAENIFQKARVLIANIVERKQAIQRLQMRSRNVMLRELEHGILTTLEIADLTDTLTEKLSYQSIDSCFIALYEESIPSRSYARLIFAYHNKKRRVLNPTQDVFVAKQLLPDNLLSQPTQFSIVVEALYFREEQIGFVVFGMDLSKDSGLYTVLRQQLSTALRGALLLQTHKQTAEELARHRDHLEQMVQNRTIDLMTANEKLSQENAERIKAEAEIRRLNVQLEERVKQRTAELTIANERLKALSQAKDEFVSNVSHELRTPISNLRLYLHLLSRNPEKLEEYCAVLSRETGRLSGLIEALLTISRMDQSQVEVRFSAVDLNQIVEEYVRDRLLLAQQKGLALSANLTSPLHVVMVDRELIGQALSILLTNAFNYTSQGGKIIIETHTRHLNNQYWSGISVNDTGVGISLEDQQQLFNRFFRGGAGRDMGVQGTGLGLALAKEIMDLHSGKIEVFSTGVHGEGTSFYLWLPASQQDQ